MPAGPTARSALPSHPAEASERLVVNWISFGPYHHARIAAATRQFEANGIEVVALATAARDQMYAWEPGDRARPYPVDVVFPDAVYQELQPRELAARMWQKLERLNPSGVAIPSYATPESRASLLWCRQRRRTAVMMTDSKRDDAARRPWREWMKRSLVAEYDAALVSGTRARSYLCELGMSSDVIRLGYDVVDNEFFARQTAKFRLRLPPATLPGLGDAEPFFLASGRLIPRKDTLGLVRAYGRYRATSQRPWRLVVLGDGPEMPKLLSYIKSEGVAGVTLAGHHGDPEVVARYYAGAKCFIHPPLQEQWGLVVNEAMASRLPVIVSMQSGCAPELVQEGINGFTFDASNHDQLPELLQRLSTLPEQKLDELGSASARIVSQWSPDRFAVGLWEAFEVGRATSERSSTTTTRAIIGLTRLGARRTNSFFTTAP